MRPDIEQPDMQNRRLDPTDLAKCGETHGSTGMGPGLDHQEVTGQVSGWFWNRTELFSRSKAGPLAGYPDRMVTQRGSRNWNAV